MTGARGDILLELYVVCVWVCLLGAEIPRDRMSGNWIAYKYSFLVFTTRGILCTFGLYECLRNKKFHIHSSVLRFSLYPLVVGR